MLTGKMSGILHIRLFSLYSVMSEYLKSLHVSCPCPPDIFYHTCCNYITSQDKCNHFLWWILYHVCSRSTSMQALPILQGRYFQLVCQDNIPPSIPVPRHKNKFVIKADEVA